MQQILLGGLSIFMSTFRQYRWLWILAVAAACLFGFWLSLPLIVSRLGESYLKGQGVDEVRLRVQSVGTHNATVLRSRAATPDWELDVDLLQVEYRLSVLWKQQLRQLNVDGARLRLQIPEPELLELPVERPVPSIVTTDSPPPETTEPVDPLEDPASDRPPVGFEPGPLATDVEPELKVFPLADPFAWLYGIPVREMQLSRSKLVLQHAKGSSPEIAVDLSLRPVGQESHWRVDLGSQGIVSQLDLQVEPPRKQVRLSGAIGVGARSTLGDWEHWLRGIPDRVPKVPDALDWGQLQVQFLNEWREGRMRMLSLQAELRDVHWRGENGTEWGGSNHAVATWTIDDDRSLLFFGAGLEGFAWQDFAFGDGYAEGQLDFKAQQARLQWAPIGLRYDGRLIGQVSGEANVHLIDALGASAELYWETAGPVPQKVPIQLQGSWGFQDNAAFQLRLGDEAKGTLVRFSSDWEQLSAYRGSGKLIAQLDAGALDWIPLDWQLPDEVFGWYSGALSIDVDWDSRGFLPRGRGEIVLDALDWTDPGGQIELRNLRGTIPFRFLGPPQVLGRPVLRADSLSVAGFELENLSLRFRLPALDALEVEAATADMAGGEVSLRPFRVNLVGSSISLETSIEFRDINARELQALLPEGGYAVEGRLNGRLPLRYQNGEWSLGEGYLRLDSDSKGTFRFTDEVFLRETIPLEPDQLEMSERFYEALMQGVQLSSLEIRLFDRDQPDVPLYLALSGEARTDRLIVPVEGLVIRNRIDPADLRELMDMLGLGWLRW